ncbi:MAG: radical SAM protein [Candidatus Scalindua sp.]|nr:radical SAM protein [Candidatus Scalindua sp.]
MLKDFWKHLRIYSTRKLYNLIMGKIQFSIGSTHLYYYPAKITIESGNICNLRCPLCPTGQKDASASKGLLSFSDFKKIIDEIGRNLLLIRLYNWGEPLLNKELVKMVEYANEHRIAVKISTNLSFPIEDAQAEALINANLQKIYISCDGASNSTYPKYHIDGDFNRVMSNMKLLLKKKRQLRNNYTGIIWLFHVFSHNEHEINTAKLMAKEIGIKLTINKIRTDMGKEIFETAEKSLERDSKWLPANPEYNTFNMTDKKPKNRFNCDLLWKETVINWDSCILPCCSVYSETHSFGNIKEDSFKNIWNNQKYIAARKEVLGRNNKTKTVCHVCKANDYLYI